MSSLFKSPMQTQLAGCTGSPISTHPTPSPRNFLLVINVISPNFTVRVHMLMSQKMRTGTHTYVSGSEGGKTVCLFGWLIAMHGSKLALGHNYVAVTAAVFDPLNFTDSLMFADSHYTYGRMST